MKPISVDLGPGDRQKRIRILLGANSVVLLLLLISASLVWQKAQVRDSARRQIELLEARAGDQPDPRAYVAQALRPSSGDEILKASLTQKRDILASIEDAAMVGVTPVAMVMNNAEGSVQIQVRFSSYAVLGEYVGRLNKMGVANWVLAGAGGDEYSQGLVADIYGRLVVSP